MVNLVTGGAGFLAVTCVIACLSVVRRLSALDNFFTGRRQNVIHLLDNPKFELMRHDVVDLSSWK